MRGSSPVFRLRSLLGALALLSICAPSWAEPSAGPTAPLMGGDQDLPRGLMSQGLQDNLDRAVAIGRSGDLKNALILLNQAVIGSPRVAEPWQRRAYVRYLLGDYVGAISDYDQAGFRGTHSGYVVYAQAWAYFADTNYLQALSGFGIAGYKWGPVPEVKAAQADAELALGRFEDAAKAADEALTLRPGMTAALGIRANIRFSQGRYHEAIADYEAAAKTDPDEATWLRGAGALRAWIGDCSGAVEELGRGLALNPENAAIYLERGTVRVLQNQMDLARHDFSAAASLWPNDAEVHFMLAESDRIAGDNRAALAEYDKADAARPDNALLLERRGRAKLELRDDPGAISDLNRAANLRPDFSDPLVDWANLEARRGNHQSTIDYLSVAIQIAERDKTHRRHLPYWRKIARPTDPDGNPAPFVPDFAGFLAVGQALSPSYLYYLRALQFDVVQDRASALTDCRTSVSLAAGDLNQRLLARLEALKAP
jgi:tetratricopeptide (TPR) repeat protein